MPIKAAFILPHPPLLLPEIGGGQERKIQKTLDSCHQVARRIAEIKPDTIIITTPHSIMYSDYIHISPGRGAGGSFREFGHGDVSMEAVYDTDLVNEISKVAEEEGISAGPLGQKNKYLDHGVMVPLYFVNKYYRDYKLVRVSLSGLSHLDHYKFGKLIGRLAEKADKTLVFIASGDLSHMLKDEGPYGYREEGPIFDRQVTQAMKSGDFLEFLKFDPDFCEAAAECGLRSFIIMAGALDKKSVSPSLMSYEGPFGVGYAVAAFEVTGHDQDRSFDEIYLKNERERLEALKEEEDEYVRLARQTLETYVIHRKIISRPQGLSQELLKSRAGVFVSLKLDGNLRGCIGTISPTRESIADEIIQNAISAGTEDPRFYPVTEEELKRLVYSVDILGKPEKIQSKDDLDPQKYGVIVSTGSRRGLLLPNLEGVKTVDDQVSIALRKAGISPKEKYDLERFEVVRHK